jgi:hypothetical protein
MDQNEQEPLVFVVDLRAPAMAEVAQLVAHGEASDAAPAGRSLPEVPSQPISHLALLMEGRQELLFLPLEPTQDVEYLDTLARLLRIAVLSGKRIPTVAVEYGEEQERELAFSRRLPHWAYHGVPEALAASLPAELEVVLGPRPC